jgi:hypothetical protein
MNPSFSSLRKDEKRIKENITTIRKKRKMEIVRRSMKRVEEIGEDGVE